MFRTFRQRLLFWFLVFISFSIIVMGLSYTYIQQRERIFTNVDLLDRAHVMMLKSVKTQQDFFTYESKNEEYFRTLESTYLERYKEQRDSTFRLMRRIDLPDDALDRMISNQKDSIMEADSLFWVLVQKIDERGFKDYNLEGAMRQEAHWLEDSTNLLQRDILMLRRHEKDYIIRNDQVYIQKFNAEVERLKNQVKREMAAEGHRKEQTLQKLQAYQDKFNQLVALDQVIGNKDNSGLKKIWDDKASRLENHFSEVVKDTRKWSRWAFDRLTLLFTLTAALLVAVSILISAWIASKITKPLRDLTEHISAFVQSNFTLETDHPVVRSRDEIGSLTQNFSVLKDEVISRMKFFKQKVEERTAELAAANERLTRISAANSRFVPVEFLQRLGKSGIEEVRLGDHVEQEMTVLFTDIRDFTRISEGLGPQENFDFLNQYLGGVVPIIEKHGGFIDKFVGDSVMALFPGHPDSAIRATLEFEVFLEAFNLQWVGQGKAPVVMGTGFHTGNLILGTIGHDNRLETTVISDAVNTAARVEGLTKHYGARAIFTGKIHKKIVSPEDFCFRFLDKVKVKGKSKTISIYELLSPADKKKIHTLAEYEKAVALLKKENISEAAECFRRLHELNPEDKAVKLLLARCERHLNSDNDIWNDETLMLNK
jgi:class 3 adenylate cyclase/HAMP domain-containing protein